MSANDIREGDELFTKCPGCRNEMVAFRRRIHNEENFGVEQYGSEILVCFTKGCTFSKDRKKIEEDWKQSSKIKAEDVDVWNKKIKEQTLKDKIDELHKKGIQRGQSD